MSSILDALRKVESEKTKEKVDLSEVDELLAERDILVPGEEQHVRTGGARKPGVRFLWIIVGALAVAGLVGIGFALRTVMTDHGRPQVVSEPVPRTSAGVSESMPEQRAPLTEEIVSPEPSSSRGLAVSDRTPPVEAPPPPAKSEPTVALAAPPAKPSAAPVRETAEAPPPEVEKESSPAVTEEKATAAPESPVEALPGELPQEAGQRPTLKINVLAQPSEQYPYARAVVNGELVKGGDYVNGAKVIQIKEQAIVFEYGDDLFEVEF